MKRFEFSLDTMLSYKDALLEKEKNILLQIRARLVAVEQRMERCHSQILTMDNEMKEKAQQGTTVLELKIFEFQLTNSRNLLDQLEVDRKKITAEVEKQRKVVLGLSQEVFGLDKLKEKQLEEYRYDVQKEEELRIGEIVSSKYVAERIS